MSRESRSFFEKAEESLSAAQLLRAKKMNNSASSRARYAVHQAQIAALVELAPLKGPPETWQRKAVEGAFAGRLVRRRSIFGRETVGHVAELQSLRIKADYSAEPVSDHESDKAITRAQRIVADIQAAVEW